MKRLLTHSGALLAAAGLLAGCGGGASTTPDPSAAGASGALPPVTITAEGIGELTLEHTQLSGRVPHFLSQGVPGLPATEKVTLPGAAELTGRVNPGDGGSYQSGLGTFELRLDEDLNTELLVPREAMAQGDHYLLGAGQFFGPQHLKISRVHRLSADELEITVSFKHPIPTPPDLTPPPTAAKRLDLHVFNLWCGMVVPNSQTFFPGASQVTTNTRILRNADSYRPIGGLATLPPGSGSILPGRWVVDPMAGQNLTQGTYIPTSNGWSGGDLPFPRGYGVFPQGGEATATFIIDLTTVTGPINLNFILLADYTDPRAGATQGERFRNRLPDPFDPRALRYVLPFGAGDLQRVLAAMSGNLPIDNSVARNVSVEITDFDADNGTTDTFPNDSNLGLLPRASGIAGVTGHFPDLDTAILNGTQATGSGNGFPATPKRYDVQVRNNLSAPAGTYFGLIKVVDQESGQTSGAPYFQLDPNLVPLTQLVPIEAYQAVRAVVAGGGGPSGPKEIVLEGDEDDPSFVLGDGSGGFAPWVDDAATQTVGGLSVDDVYGVPIMGFAGPNFFGDPTRYGRGVFNVFLADPSSGGNFNVPGFGFQNSATAPNPAEPRSQPIRTFHASRAFSDTVFSPTAKGVWGWADLLTAGVTSDPAAFGRGFVPMFEDFDTFVNNRATWNGGPIFRTLFAEVFGSAPEVNPTHVGGSEQTLIATFATSDFDRGPATPREAYANDMVTILGLKGPYNPAQETTPTILQLYDSIDYNNPATPEAEDYWGRYRWVGPSVNSQNRPAIAGAGPGKINAKTTVGADFARDADKLFILDSADGTVEVYKALPDGLPQINDDSFNDEFQYLDIASNPADLTNPRDICVIGDGNGGSIVIVLDRGGNNGFWRLVAMDPNTLAVLGTRSLHNEIPEGALSIASDNSLANGLDATAFVLLWDDPLGSNPDIGPVGGMYWYTVRDA